MMRPVPNKGFTLIELLVTVTIVMILASVAMPLAELSVQRTKEQDLRRSLQEIRTAIDRYKQACDEGHIAKSPSDSGYPRSLAALVEGVTDAKSIEGKKMYFLRKLPRDPFADEFHKAEESWGKRSYDSPPDDPKEGADVFDVYSLSAATGLDGTPYREW